MVALHTWSYDLEQRDLSFETEAKRRNWFYLFPNFRGVNDHPAACASELAQQDILDAVAWAKAHLKVDSHRIYLLGESGGGQMALIMAARAPELWAAASVWVPISDLIAFRREHEGDLYGTMVELCVGGGNETVVAAEYRARSPVTQLAQAASVPIDISAGRCDGHAPPVHSLSIAHSLLAFNVLARAVGATPVSEDEIAQLSRPDGYLDHPSPGDTTADPEFGRPVFLRRTAGPSRVTIFDGGHEALAPAAFAWLQNHVKPQ